MIKIFKSAGDVWFIGKMSGPLIYLVAFRSGKWPDGRLTTNTLDQDVFVHHLDGYISLGPGK